LILVGPPTPSRSGRRFALAAKRLPLPCSTRVRFLPGLKAGASSEEPGDEQYEGCLSFFDVRGLVPRPLQLTVETTTLDGTTMTTVYERRLARLIAHEIDHLDGLLYLNRMRPGVEQYPREQYRQTGRAWAYGS
jgi:peptide deformylase